MAEETVNQQPIEQAGPATQQVAPAEAPKTSEEGTPTNVEKSEAKSKEVAVEAREQVYSISPKERETYFALARTAPGMDENDYKTIQTISTALFKLSKNNAALKTGSVFTSFADFKKTPENTNANLAILRDMFRTLDEKYNLTTELEFNKKFDGLFGSTKGSVGLLINYLKGTKTTDSAEIQFRKELENKFDTFKLQVEGFRTKTEQQKITDLKDKSDEIIEKAATKDAVKLRTEINDMEPEDNGYHFKVQQLEQLKKDKDIIELESITIEDAKKLYCKGITDDKALKTKEKEFNEMWKHLTGNNKEHGRVFANNETGELYITAPLSDKHVKYDKETGNVSFKTDPMFIPRDLCVKAETAAELIKGVKNDALPEGLSLNLKGLKLANYERQKEKDKDGKETEGKGLIAKSDGFDIHQIAGFQGLSLLSKDDKGRKKNFNENPTLNDLADLFYKQAKESGAKNHVQALMVTKLRLLTMNPIPGKENLTAEQYHEINEIFDKQINEHLKLLPNDASTRLAYHQEQAGKALAECFRKSNINIQDIPYFLEKNGLALDVPSGLKYLDISRLFKFGGFKKYDKNNPKVKNDFAMTDKTHTGARVWGQTEGFKYAINKDDNVKKWTATATRMASDANYKAERIEIYQAAITEMMTMAPNGADAAALAAIVTQLTVNVPPNNKPALTLKELFIVNGKPSKSLEDSFYKLCGTKKMEELSKNNRELTAGDGGGTAADASALTSTNRAPVTYNAETNYKKAKTKPVVKKTEEDAPLQLTQTDEIQAEVDESLNNFNMDLQQAQIRLGKALPNGVIRAFVTTETGKSGKEKITIGGKFATTNERIDIALGIYSGEFDAEGLAAGGMISNIHINDIERFKKLFDANKLDIEGLKEFAENNRPQLDPEVLESMYVKYKNDGIFVLGKDKNGEKTFRLNGANYVKTAVSDYAGKVSLAVETLRERLLEAGVEEDQIAAEFARRGLDKALTIQAFEDQVASGYKELKNTLENYVPQKTIWVADGDFYSPRAQRGILVSLFEGDVDLDSPNMVIKNIPVSGFDEKNLKNSGIHDTVISRIKKSLKDDIRAESPNIEGKELSDEIEKRFIEKHCFTTEDGRKELDGRAIVIAALTAGDVIYKIYKKKFEDDAKELGVYEKGRADKLEEKLTERAIHMKKWKERSANLVQASEVEEVSKEEEVEEKTVSLKERVIKEEMMQEELEKLDAAKSEVEVEVKNEETPTVTASVEQAPPEEVDISNLDQNLVGGVAVAILHNELADKLSKEGVLKKGEMLIAVGAKVSLASEEIGLEQDKKGIYKYNLDGIAPETISKAKEKLGIEDYKNGLGMELREIGSKFITLIAGLKKISAEQVMGSVLSQDAIKWYKDNMRAVPNNGTSTPAEGQKPNGGELGGGI